jgi:hypothetical protein
MPVRADKVSRHRGAQKPTTDSWRRSSMSRTQTTDLNDSLDTKVVLSGLWVSMLFVFAYVDILAFWRADIINGALAGKVPGTGFGIGQTFLAICTVYILAPTLMVVVSLLAPARVNRVANIVVSVLYVLSIGATVIGETWIYYILGSVVEVALLLTIARIAWTWPGRYAGGHALRIGSKPSVVGDSQPVGR